MSSPVETLTQPLLEVKAVAVPVQQQQEAAAAVPAGNVRPHPSVSTLTTTTAGPTASDHENGNVVREVVTTTTTTTTRSTRRRREGGCCETLGNVIWIVFGGWHLCLTWMVAGIVLCLTIIGIPFGLQCFKIAIFILVPFGKKITYSTHGDNIDNHHVGGGGCCQPNGCCCHCCLCLGNLLWALSIGWILAIQALVTGIVFCVTICGIPFGIQCFKLMRFCFCPFGLTFITTNDERFEEMITRRTTEETTTQEVLV